MGKPTFCFKIITCGGDSKDHEDIDVSESKATGEKRGWSFRKRSTRQRVLRTSVIAETLPSETPACDSVQTANSKFVTDNANEKPQLSCPENGKPFEVVVSAHDEDEEDDQVEESIAIVIQTAIRGLLAQMALTKLKSVVRIQAAARGHVVRRHAVGTLRCIQAIVKMQALVRARSSLRDGSDRKDNNEFDESKVAYVSMEKLLSNRFARLLLDWTPKSTAINIKCDPLKSDSAWKWLERWMSVSSVDMVEQNKAEETILENARNGKEGDFVPRLDIGTDPEVSDSNNAIFIEPLEGEAEPEEMKDTTRESEIDESECDNNPEMKVEEREQPTTKGVQQEIDCRKSVVGLRKATSPAFIAAQLRFEALSSSANSGKSTSLSLEDSTESREQTASTPTNAAVETKELDSSRVILSGGSECGSELSISSTLDSLDRRDSVTLELEHNGNVLPEEIQDSNRTKTSDFEQVDVSPAVWSTNLSQPILEEAKKSDLVIHEYIVSEDGSDPGTIEVKGERNTVHQPEEVDSETRNQGCRLSPEASPTSHVTVPESQEGTPSSQLSVKAANKNKADKSGSNSKRTRNSGSRSSPDHLGKDQKIGRRRNSFGSAAPDNAEPESRDGTADSSLLPHFMQATESARAKLNSNPSPRSSPDVQDRNIYIKKRRSSSVTNGRQGSPRSRRSMSQTQQSAKGNENKWQR